MWVGYIAVFLLIFLIGVAIAAARDPEGGLSDPEEPLIISKESFVEAEQRELFNALAAPLAQRGLSLFPNVPIENIFRRGRLTATGWHRLSHSLIDFVLISNHDARPAGLILFVDRALETYLDKENVELKAEALAESGIPVLELDNGDRQVEEILQWVDGVVRYKTVGAPSRGI